MVMSSGVSSEVSSEVSAKGGLLCSRLCLLVFKCPSGVRVLRLGCFSALLLSHLLRNKQV